MHIQMWNHNGRVVRSMKNDHGTVLSPIIECSKNSDG